MEEFVTKELFEECISDLRRELHREVSSVKTTVTDAEMTLMAGQNTVAAKVDKVNGSVGLLKEWQIRHDGVEEGRKQLSQGLRNWIILGFGLTTAIQAAIGITIYLAAS